MIDEYSPQHLRREAKELRAAFPVHAGLVHHAQVRLVDDRRALKGVRASLTAQMQSRKRAQLALDKRQ
jgi:hypothetical protein